MLLLNNVKKEENSTTQLFMAAQNGHSKRAMFLKALQILRKSRNGVIPIFKTAKNDHTDVRTVLLENKTNVNGKWKDDNVCIVT